MVDGYLKGAGMDTIDSLFAFFANYPSVRNSPVDWIPVYLPWIIFELFVFYVASFGRLLGIVAFVLAFVFGRLYESNLMVSEFGLVCAMVVGLWSVYRHVLTRANPWWL